MGAKIYKNEKEKTGQPDYVSVGSFCGKHYFRIFLFVSSSFTNLLVTSARRVETYKLKPKAAEKDDLTAFPIVYDTSRLSVSHPAR